MEEDKKIISVNRKVAFIVSDTLTALKENFDTQRIYPFEVYPGYKEKNEKVKKGWKSTGCAYRSFRGEVLSSKIDDVHIRFTYMYYMRFVDMGVGKGRKIGDVNTQLDASRKVRYVRIWNAAKGETHRPALMMEYKRQSKRLESYWIKAFEEAAMFTIMRTLDGMEINIGEE